jgi:hypothetical protein
MTQNGLNGACRYVFVDPENAERVAEHMRREWLGDASFICDALHHALNSPGRPRKFIMHHKKVF